MPDSELQSISNDVRALVGVTKTYGERLAVTEARQISLIDSVNKMTTALTEYTVSNARVEEKLISLEESAVNKISIVDSKCDSLNDKVDLLSGRVQVIEIINGKNQGIEEANNENDKKWYAKWQKTIMVLTLLLASATFIFQFFINKGATP